MFTQIKLFEFIYKAIGLHEMIRIKIGDYEGTRSIYLPPLLKDKYIICLGENIQQYYQITLEQLLSLLKRIGQIELIYDKEFQVSSFLGQCFLTLMEELEECGLKVQTAENTKFQIPEKNEEIKTELLSEELMAKIETAGRVYVAEKRRGKEIFEDEAESFMEQASIQKIKTIDHYTLEYKVFSEEREETLVLINAYGIPFSIWKYIIYYYASDFRVITWNTRGTVIGPEDMEVISNLQASDLELILNKEKIERVHMICWCSGLKLFNEFYKRKPDTVESLVIISGYFNPIPSKESYWTDFDITIGRLSKMILADKQLAANPLLLGLIDRLFHFNIGAKRLEGNSKEFDYNEIYQQMLKTATPNVKELIVTPFRHCQTLINYARITEELQRVEIITDIATLHCNTLIINAGLDMITDIHCGIEGNSNIPNATYVELANATHWSIWENYDEITKVVDNFYRIDR